MISGTPGVTVPVSQVITPMAAIAPTWARVLPGSGAVRTVKQVIRYMNAAIRQLAFSALRTAFSVPSASVIRPLSWSQNAASEAGNCPEIRSFGIFSNTGTPSLPIIR